MAGFKIPFIQSKSFTKGYFDGIPSFRWCDVVDKDEIGKGSFGSVLKATHVIDNKTVVVKRFFGEGDSNLKNVAKEAKMLQNVRHPEFSLLSSFTCVNWLLISTCFSCFG
ncbi:LIM domain kinase 2 [Desmophyllum pertusum]|uniref:LIM domain kinase 2 n=1 Tax=Desmophyllum pertusum TaxID=174260 RepID=A0A9W9YNH2_9CNID|nr:LIM domain kinase 2 [Desmophyllum pertusum]